MSVGVRTVDRATAGQLPEKIGNLLHESRWLALGGARLPWEPDEREARDIRCERCPGMSGWASLGRQV